MNARQKAAQAKLKEALRIKAGIEVADAPQAAPVAVLTAKDEAKAKAKATREAMASAGVVATIAAFKPRFQIIEGEQQHVIEHVREVVAEMLVAVPTAANADGKTMFMRLVRACTTNSYVAQIAGHWTGILLAKGAGKSIGHRVLEYGVDGAPDKIESYTLENLDSAKDLFGASKYANASLGVKPRGAKQAKKGTEVKAPVGADIWTALKVVVGSQAGRAELRRYLNSWGYELTQLQTTENLPALIKAA